MEAFQSSACGYVLGRGASHFQIDYRVLEVCSEFKKPHYLRLLYFWELMAIYLTVLRLGPYLVDKTKFGLSLNSHFLPYPEFFQEIILN